MYIFVTIIFFFTWVFLSYEYGLQSLLIVIPVLPMIIFLYLKMATVKKDRIMLTSILFFVINIFYSFYVAVIILYLAIRNKLYKGIVEMELNDISPLQLFFLSLCITITPDTVYFLKEDEYIIFHKISDKLSDAHLVGNIFFDKRYFKRK